MLKELLLTPPVLKVAEANKQYVLQTDASEQGLGAVLSQLEENGEEHPVAFASRKLLPREKNYSVVEKECLAIVWSLQMFHMYLYGQRFVIETATLLVTSDEESQSVPYPMGIGRTAILFRNASSLRSKNGNADGLS